VPCCFNWLRSLAALTLCIMIANCSEPEHPDTVHYEYMYMNGKFVAPYHSFPSGPDREGWQCFDGKTRRTFDCTFIRDGGFGQFQYIFRPRV